MSVEIYSEEIKDETQVFMKRNLLCDDVVNYTELKKFKRKIFSNEETRTAPTEFRTGNEMAITMKKTSSVSPTF